MKLWSLIAATMVVGACFFLVSIIPSGADTANKSFDQSYQAARLKVDGFMGTAAIEMAAPGSPIRVQISGTEEMMKRLDVVQQGDAVVVHMASIHKDYWWPWSLLNWQTEKYDNMRMVVTMPKGLPVDIDGFNGNFKAGDIDAPFIFGAVGGGEAQIGRAMDTRLSIAGSSDIRTGDIAGLLNIEIAGSGDIQTGKARDTRIEIAGAGSARTGPVVGALRISIAGSGEARIEDVQGKVEIDIAGSGEVLIDGGRADPFSASIAGSGEVVFRGEAVNPRVEIIGSGDVRVARYSGELRQEFIGSGNFSTNVPPAPKPPSPPEAAPPAGPAAPPVPPSPAQPPQPPAGPGRTGGGAEPQKPCPPSDVCVHPFPSAYERINPREAATEAVRVINPLPW